MTGTTVTTVQERSQKLAAYFENNAAKFSALMPDDQIGRFMRVMNNAILRDPQIAEATTTSVFLECQKAASDGLVLDGREAVLTRFKTNKRQKVNGQWVDNWQTEVVYIPMIKGLRKLVYQSPQVSGWTTGLVHEEEYKQDRFKYISGDSPKLYHEPIIIGEKGPVVAAYSVVRLKNGQVSVDVMTRGKLDAIKNRTKSKRKKKVGNNEVEEITGPWATDEEEMFIKTVARHHFKSLPLGGKADDAATRIDGLYDMNREDIDDIEPEEVKPPPKSVVNKRTTSAAAKLAAARPQPGPDEEGDPKGSGDSKTIDHDPDTGVVHEGEIVDESDLPDIRPGDEF